MRYRVKNTRAYKLALVKAILANPSYSADSGLIRDLQKKLMGLSCSDLGNLKLVLDLQFAHVKDQARRGA